jgi:phosphoesterase RecJ-like protein
VIYSEEKRREFKRLLKSHKGVTVISHTRPDGDAIGSSLGVYHTLKDAGYAVEIANFSKKLPRKFSFLKDFEKIKSRIEFKDSLVVACDSGVVERLGFNLEDRDIVNIDHHISNKNYGVLNVVDGEAVSSSEVVFYLLEPMFDIPKSASEAFYVALLSDSRHFQTSSVTVRSFDLAKRLIERGVNPSQISREMGMNRSLASLRVLTKALNSLTLHHQGRVATLEISSEDLAETGADEYDREGIAEFGRELSTVLVSILIIELGDKIKVSLRSKGVDVLKIANRFGGGGHKEASGFEIDGKDSSIDEVKREILEYISRVGVLD